VRQRKVRPVDTHSGRAVDDEVAQLAGDVAADVLLRFLGRATDVWCEDHVVEAAQLADELISLAGRLVGKDVDGRAGEMPAFDVGAQRRVVDDEPARQVQEQAALEHPGELVGAEDVTVGGAAVDVQRHDVGAGQQLVETVAALGVAERQLVGRVVERDRHAERLGQHGELRTYVAVADDAEPATADLVSTGGGLVPDAGVHVGVLLGQPPGERDDLREGKLDDAACVGKGRVEHRDAARVGGFEVDLVGADAKRTDRQQVGRGRKRRRGDVRLGADAEQLHPLERLDQLALAQRPIDGVDGDAGVGQQGHRIRVDVFEEECTHLTRLRVVDATRLPAER
jgi:hypothetical protein